MCVIIMKTLETKEQNINDVSFAVDIGLRQTYRFLKCQFQGRFLRLKKSMPYLKMVEEKVARLSHSRDLPHAGIT